MKRYGGFKTNRRIIEIRRTDKLSRADLAELTGYSEGYVTAWLLPRSSKYWKRAPANAVRLLEFETDRRAPSRRYHVTRGYING